MDHRPAGLFGSIMLPSSCGVPQAGNGTARASLTIFAWKKMLHRDRQVESQGVTAKLLRFASRPALSKNWNLQPTHYAIADDWRMARGTADNLLSERCGHAHFNTSLTRAHRGIYKGPHTTIQLQVSHACMHVLTGSLPQIAAILHLYRKSTQPSSKPRLWTMT